MNIDPMELQKFMRGMRFAERLTQLQGFEVIAVRKYFEILVELHDDLEPSAQPGEITIELVPGRSVEDGRRVLTDALQKLGFTVLQEVEGSEGGVLVHRNG
ncbi:hypothetical protein C4571_03700 [Candidatus Parcubacteria bacterium]|nr:MAG: hypothetical protein C4571_03700 [Candidatus Parcubacteria bacterium]